MSGHKARLTAVYPGAKNADTALLDGFALGLQRLYWVPIQSLDARIASAAAAARVSTPSFS